MFILRAKYDKLPLMRILITGATGLIGREVGKALAEKGHDIVVISRSLAKAREQLPFPCDVITGDLSQGPLHDEKLKNVEAVINLIGEPVIGMRWSQQKKDRIYSSRVDGTRNLIASLPSTVKTFIAGGAVGFYGERGDEIAREGDLGGRDFLAKVCVDWEAAAMKAPGRKVLVRTGIVLARQGGAIDQMLFPFRAGVGGILGSGRHWMSWIHIKDIVGLFLFALENENVEGPLNGVSPEPVTNAEFSETLARVLGKRLGPPVPHFALKMLFGEAAGVMLMSLRASADHAISLGYQFHYDDLTEALREVCAPWQNGEEYYSSEQFLAMPPEKVFGFFADPENLERVTPPEWQLRVGKMSASQLTQGAQIEYSLKVHGVPLKWKTEIDEWQPPFKFIDRQKLGPYRLWQHTHEFYPFRGGTLMVDKLRYRLPLGSLGWLAGGKFIRKDIEELFNFRRKMFAALDTPPKG